MVAAKRRGLTISTVAQQPVVVNIAAGTVRPGRHGPGVLVGPC